MQFNQVESIKSSDPFTDELNNETKNDIEFLNDLNELIQNKEDEKKKKQIRFGKQSTVVGSGYKPFKGLEEKIPYE